MGGTKVSQQVSKQPNLLRERLREPQLSASFLVPRASPCPRGCSLVVLRGAAAPAAGACAPPVRRHWTGPSASHSPPPAHRPKPYSLFDCRAPDLTYRHPHACFISHPYPERTHLHSFLIPIIAFPLTKHSNATPASSFLNIVMV